MYSKKEIAESLKTARKRAGFSSARAFAQAIAISDSAYSEYEKGRVSIPVATACKIADFLDISLDELVGRDFQTLYKSPHELELITHYRACTPDRKQMLVQTAADMAAISKEAGEPAQSVLTGTGARN